ncbi:hypothetical protein EVAR_50703_1 [Eumeta japonica]|uniref:Uncharacterized protein n=1 Tax=Eumeta variegata TaxID=151549 RepID=A0A4C1YR30_EUMVA|nr:hypothetical protein EVAR_50703_1 [Eumeta japonica]
MWLVLRREEGIEKWWGESAVPPAPAVAAVPPQRPSVPSAVSNSTIISYRDEQPSASPPKHHVSKDGKL